jgi:hypothetical protein
MAGQSQGLFWSATWKPLWSELAWGLATRPANLQLRSPVRTASVPSARSARLPPCAHGHMTDGAGFGMIARWRLARSGTVHMGRDYRSVKPSAQPTLVRTQHLPQAAKTARGLGSPVTRAVVRCVILCRRRSIGGAVPRWLRTYSGRIRGWRSGSLNRSHSGQAESFDLPVAERRSEGYGHLQPSGRSNAGFHAADSASG